MKVDGIPITLNNQQLKANKTGSFLAKGNRLKVALSSIKKHILPSNKKGVKGKDIKARNIKTAETNVNVSKTNKNRDYDKTKTAITLKISENIEEAKNKKELKAILQELNFSYMIDSSISEQQYQKLFKQAHDKLHYLKRS